MNNSQLEGRHRFHCVGIIMKLTNFSVYIIHVLPIVPIIWDAGDTRTAPPSAPMLRLNYSSDFSAIRCQCDLTPPTEPHWSAKFSITENMTCNVISITLRQIYLTSTFLIRSSNSRSRNNSVALMRQGGPCSRSNNPRNCSRNRYLMDSIQTRRDQYN